MEGSENEQSQGRTHVLPSAGDSVGYWIRIGGGVIGIVTVVVTITTFILNQGSDISVLKTQVQAQDARISHNSETIERIYTLLTEIKVDIGEIKGVLAANRASK